MHMSGVCDRRWVFWWAADGFVSLPKRWSHTDFHQKLTLYQNIIENCYELERPLLRSPPQGLSASQLLADVRFSFLMLWLDKNSKYHVCTALRIWNNLHRNDWPMSDVTQSAWMDLLLHLLWDVFEWFGHVTRRLCLQMLVRDGTFQLFFEKWSFLGEKFRLFINLFFIYESHRTALAAAKPSQVGCLLVAGRAYHWLFQLGHARNLKLDFLRISNLE